MNARKFTTIVLLLVFGTLLCTACQPVQAMPDAQASTPSRQVQGELYFASVPEWGGVAISMEIDAVETNAETHEAAGTLNWRNFLPAPGEGETYWKVVDSQPRYIFFGADVPGADPNTVVILTQIDNKMGWGQGEPGEYGAFWFRDGGADASDQWGNTIYSFDPWYEFYPADAPPLAEGYFGIERLQEEDPVLPLTAELGNIVITQ